jgi:hypothetical protein
LSLSLFASITKFSNALIGPLALMPFARARRVAS